MDETAAAPAPARGSRRIGVDTGEDRVSATSIVVVILCLVLLIGLSRLLRRSALRTIEYRWRPQALEHASIAYAEQKFFTKKPFPLVAKIDRAYRTGDGLVLVELKRRWRRRAYTSDTVELSAQKVAIERSTGETVAGAYVVVEHPETLVRTAIEVPLLVEAGVVELARRHAKVMQGKIRPEKANRIALCSACAYADQCRPDVLRGRGD